MNHLSLFTGLLVSIFLITIWSCSEDLEQFGINEDNTQQLTEEEMLIRDLNNEVIELTKDPLELSDGDLSFLDNIAPSRIIGMGEASHGTKQFFDMKHRMFRYLVENHDFKAIIFEMDMGEALIFNDWVQHRTAGDITTIMVDKMLFNVWRTEEVRALLMWMRDYNNGRVEDEMIGFYGVDLQYPTYNAHALIEIISRIDEEQANRIEDLSTNFLNIRDYYWGAEVDSISLIIKEELRQIGEILFINNEVIVNSLGSTEALWSQRLYRNMIQVEDRLYDVVVKGERFKRDLYMAENTSWYLDLLGANSKVALWAHNLHVANDPNFFPNYGAQGWHLKSDHGSDYKIIGFSFSTGTFTANVDGVFQDASIDYEPLENTSACFFSRLDYDNFVLSTSVESQTLREWIEGPIPFRTIGAGFNYNWIPEAWFYENTLPEYYDYVIHFDESRPTSLIPL